MSKRFSSQAEIEEFLAEPRLAILMYSGARPSPTGVPVWFDWDGSTLTMFAGRSSAKVKHLSNDPNISVLVTNKVGEPEGWVAFDGEVSIEDFAPEEWQALIDRVAPRYWDLSIEGYKQEIANWRSAPDMFVALKIQPERIRSGA